MSREQQTNRADLVGVGPPHRSLLSIRSLNGRPGLTVLVCACYKTFHRCASVVHDEGRGSPTSNHRERAVQAHSEHEASSGSIRVLLTESQRLFRQSLHLLLAREPDISAILEASDAQEVYRLAMAHRPDIVLLDVDLPHLDAASITHLLHKHHPKTRVLLLARYDEDARIVAAVRAGAAGYILKDTDWTDFLRILKSTASSPQALSLILPDRVVQHVPDSLRHPHEGNALRLSTLSDRERQILACAAAGQSNKEIADHLCVSVETVKTHLHHIYQKLLVDGRVEAVIAFLRAQ